MLGYHPAMDPAHAAFRATRLFMLEPRVEWEKDRLRIADFLLVFPAFIPSMRLPRQHMGWRSQFQQEENRYWYSGDPLLLFKRIRPLHQAGLQLLIGVGAVHESRWVEERTAEFDLGAVPEAVARQARERNIEESTVSDFLRSVVLPLKLTGDDGLKARTELLEHRYDPV